ncbi:DoxX family protein [Streptosporangium sp. NPDC001559]|uniref:DoxX family protein n=1 Tax=Streptosporangium jomthongense TaxID=1193683 RepID=A0ABV8F047_9ACTN
MKFIESARPYVFALFRLVVGLLFTCNGAAKLFGVLGGGALPFGSWPGWYAGVVELVGGVLVMAGLGTRIAALICSGEMAYAYFVVHQPQALWPIQNGGELSALYAWAFLLIAIVGPGAWALETVSARTRVRDRGDARPAEPSENPLTTL